MFGKMFEIGSLMKQAREIGGRMEEMNEKLKELRIEGNAGGGLVTVHVDGLQQVVGCKVDPSLFQQADSELLEDLIVAAVNDAMQEARTEQSESMKTLMGDVDMGGLSSLVEKFVKQ